MAANYGSAPAAPVPHAILKEVGTDFFLVCFESDAAGVIVDGPSIRSRAALYTEYPHIVEAWEEKQRAAREEARQIEKKALAFARYMSGHDQRPLPPKQAEPELECDQHLLPGMSEHWGKLHKCKLHHRDHGDWLICKGCRVSHYMQPDRGFDRGLIMAQGARVPMCGACAAAAVQIHGIGHRGCVCDANVSCFRCRENLLEKLANARMDKHRDGCCGRCGEEGMVQFAEICLYCRRTRVYKVL